MNHTIRSVTRPLIALLVAMTFAGTALGADPPDSPPSRASADFRPLPHQILKDAIDLGTAPLHWNRTKWLHLGEGIAVVLAAYTVDNQVSTFVSHQNNHAFTSYLKFVTQMGDGGGLVLCALMAGGGYFGHDDRLMDAGVDALESTGFASGIATPAVKLIVGRARPIFGLGKFTFHPFNPSFPSFPSGHTTNAFAIATAVATRYDNTRWVPIVAYTLATSVAVARVHDRAHFASDVLAGAMIGRAVAKSVVHNHLRAKVVVIPTSSGAIVDIRF